MLYYRTDRLFFLILFIYLFSIFGPPEHHTGIIINMGSFCHLFWKMYGNCFYGNKKNSQLILTVYHCI